MKKLMTEEDTFKKLKRISYEELEVRWTEYEKTVMFTTEEVWVLFLRKHGRTHVEWAKEWEQHNPFTDIK